MEKISYQELLRDIRKEVLFAIKKFPSFHSTHEGYAVLLEEFDELWEEIKANKPQEFTPNMKREAIQVAAMAIRFIMDLCSKD